jgi:hypothetical protein
MAASLRIGLAVRTHLWKSCSTNGGRRSTSDDGGGADAVRLAQPSLFAPGVSGAIVKKMTWLDGLEQFLRWLSRPERRIESKTERSEEAPGEPDAYRLALDEAIRAIEGQRESLDELRARAGILLSAALLVGALLGGPASQTTGLSFVAAAAVLLVLAVAVSLLVLRPTGGWKFSLGTKALLKDYIESDKPATIPELHRSLAWHMDDDYMENQRRLKWFYRLFIGASILVAGETIMWLVAIIQPRTP